MVSVALTLWSWWDGVSPVRWGPFLVYVTGWSPGVGNLCPLGILSVMLSFLLGSRVCSQDVGSGAGFPGFRPQLCN